MKKIILAAIYIMALYNHVLAGDVMSINDFSISAGETKTVNIDLESDVVYAGFQFELSLPEGITISEYSTNKDRIPESTTLAMTQQEDGSYLFLAAAMGLENIKGTSGSIITIKVSADQNMEGGWQSGYFRKVKLSKTNVTGNTYDEIYFPVTVIEPSTVRVTSCERVYGDENPEFRFVVDGGELDGTPTITCEATAESPAGTYDINISKGSVTNYNVTYFKGTLTIKKAPLTISVGNYTRKKGKENPEFILDYKGFKNGETEDVLTKTPTVTTTAAKTSTTGNYAVVVSDAEAHNYEISYVNGVLTVELQPGDANSDGEVDEKDMEAIADHIIGNTPENFDEEAADLNGDDKVNVADIVILNNLLGK